MKIRNTKHNHTGLAAVNLLLNNVWVMYKWEIKKDGKPRDGWRKGTFRLVKSFWFTHWTFHKCRIER